MPLPDRWTFVAGTSRLAEGDMRDICDALETYGSNENVNKLYIVYKEAKDWLKKNTPGFFTTKNGNAEYAHVSDLQGQVIKEFNRLDAGLGNALLNFDIQNSQRGKGGSTVSLQPFYDLERDTYVKGKKQASPFSATKTIAEIHHAGVGGKAHTKANWKAVTTPQALSQNPIPKMYFLNKIQRMRKRVTLTGTSPTVRWVDFNNQPVQTRHSDSTVCIAQAKSLQPYAMDRYGNIFIDYENSDYGILFLNAQSGTAEQDAITARGQFNHSSLVAGREVICAGCIYFWKGQLIHIDNNSGHYRPDRDALHRAVTILRDLGAELNYLRVGYRYDTGGQQNFDAFHANTFLANLPKDWPNQNLFSNLTDHSGHYRTLAPFQY